MIKISERFKILQKKLGNSNSPLFKQFSIPHELHPILLTLYYYSITRKKFEFAGSFKTSMWLPNFHL